MQTEVELEKLRLRRLCLWRKIEFSFCIILKAIYPVWNALLELTERSISANQLPIFRHALQSGGKLAPYTGSTQVQMENTLGTLLDPNEAYYPDLQRLFGQDLMLDAKRVLDAESLNIRNTMLHGLGGDHYAQDWPGRTMIQLVFRLVFSRHPGWPSVVMAPPP